MERNAEITARQDDLIEECGPHEPERPPSTGRGDRMSRGDPDASQRFQFADKKQILGKGNIRKPVNLSKNRFSNKEALITVR